jgi:hypothetical protein
MQQEAFYVATTDNRRPLMQIGLFAGLAGGLAEILWIWAYSAGTDANAAMVAQGVAKALGLGGGPNSVSLGVAIHMALAGALGIAVVAALRAPTLRRRSWGIHLALVLAALSGVWAFNFLLLLPMLSPEFVTMVPMPISFVSKLLFGLAAFAAFEASAPRTNPDL